jgi:mono/diheme cytochrome c family protein
MPSMPRPLLAHARYLASGFVLFLALTVRADEPTTRPFPELSEQFQTQTRALLSTYCLECHSQDATQGDLDLARFDTLEDVRGGAESWIKVAEMLDNGEMPPADADQPTAEERAALRGWVRDYLHAEAYAHPGDPGPFVLRRLNNAEYTYTIRDLTGVALSPAAEFPADGAAGEGFTNAAAAMSMSPALLTKYFDAAKDIAEHAVLHPEGFHFSPSKTRGDWTNDTLARIRELYRQHTDSAGASQVNLQGIVFDTNDGGRLPVAPYLRATLLERDAVGSGAKTIAQVAQEQRLNEKYLRILWDTLYDPTPSALLASLQTKWHDAKPEDAEALAAEVTAWQQALWRFTSVGHIGKVGGPTAWQEPASPLVPRQELRTPLVQNPDGGPVRAYLVVSDAGDGADGDLVIWERPRLVAEGRPDVLLRDIRAVSPEHGLDPALFGKLPDSTAIDDASLALQAPSVLEVTIPAEMAAGAELVASGMLAPKIGDEGSVQLRMTATKPEQVASLEPSATTITDAGGAWTSDNERLNYATPIVVNDASAARKRFEQAFADYREVFPAALCYTKIVPVDEVVTLTLYYREDEHLRRLMLNEDQAAELDRLWQELYFISRAPLTQVDALEQLLEFATQDADPTVFEPLREPVAARAAEFRQQMLDAEPRQLEALVEFAALAFRRPLTEVEKTELRALYRHLRDDELPHEEAFRLTLARILTSPAFLYRLEVTGGDESSAASIARPVSDWELATRLSYFLWSSSPDDELRALAAAGTLHQPEVLQAQAKRMLQDPKAERLAREFACQWLHIYEFDALDEKSERHFPEFAALRADMYEEAIRFFTAAFREDASIVSYFDADHTFVNGPLAEFYGVKPSEEPDWRRVEGLREQGRGGVLGFAATLAKQSGASRTSPILRGNWVSEVLLGEKLPKPPAGIPVLPEDEFATEGLTVRQLVEKHTSDARCAKCHRRIDPLGFALEEFDAIGRRREKDLADRPIDATTTLPDGSAVDGLPGLRDYLTHSRRDAVVRQFCRKLLGYSLGRPVQLSDQPLIDDMMAQLAKRDYRFSAAVETILASPQFLSTRVETP